MQFELLWLGTKTTEFAVLRIHRPTSSPDSYTFSAPSNNLGHMRTDVTRSYFANEFVLLVAVVSAMVASTPLPMEAARDPSPGQVDDSWWINTLNYEPLPPNPHPPDASTRQVPRYDNLLQHTSFNDLGPQHNMYQAVQPTQPFSNEYWQGGSSLASSQGSHEFGIPSTHELINPQVVDWQHDAMHYVPQYDLLHPFGPPRVDETWLEPAKAHEVPFQASAERPAEVQITHPGSQPFISEFPPPNAAAFSSAHGSAHSQGDLASTSMSSQHPARSVPSLVHEHGILPAVQVEGASEHNHKSLVIDSSKRPKRFKDARGTIAASRFLEHHPAVKISIDVPFTVSETSPEAHQLRPDINTHLFSNRLMWRTKGDDMFTSPNRDIQFRQFIQRINARRSWFTAKTQAIVPGKMVVIVPHKSYTSGNVMFDPEPRVKNLLFSFWTPSVDERRTRLLFVGSAALAVHDATEVLKRLTNMPVHATKKGREGNSPPLMPVVAAPRGRFPATVAAQHTATKSWLNTLPIVDQIVPENPEAWELISHNLISEMHPFSRRIQELANNILFENQVVWQTTPEDLMFNAKTESAAGVFRYHKRSRFIYITRPEILSLIPYRMLMIPYEIQSPRAKLFDPSLAGHSLTFTLWAGYDIPGAGRHAETYLFVSGASLGIKKTGDVLERAKNIVSQLTGAEVHGI